eukprot:CAMPEP_0201589218 /NCGR_PEP_ID=MMETSP0190_2-20130828/164108_1 /ASSEMBLY_ACC=CAM_ASM_000263 /TAXON_ID=37353 /ORGANISM="Rosalina sp." /LENGTH=110 /DNA_ID=CAMNT_0048042927 /DNA_START=40 /DNA_END=369 /DNA_ORIENTATION=+
MSDQAHKYNLNDWDNEQSRSHIPMIESKSGKKYNALSNNIDNNHSLMDNSQISMSGAEPSRTHDLRAKLSWQYQDEYKNGRNFKMVAEISYAFCLCLILMIFCGSVVGVW